MSLPVADLADRLELGLTRGGNLVTDEERAVVARVQALAPDPALLLARLVARRPRAWRLPDLACAGVGDVASAAAVLCEAGLGSPEVPWPLRLDEAGRDVLADGCRRVGLPVTGTKEVLRERLRDRTGWDDAPWLTLPCRPSLLRLERWATLEPFPDRSRPVLERLGRLRWVPYATTDGGSLLPTRDDWLAWEALVDRDEPLGVDETLAALDRPAWPPGGLDLRRELVWSLKEVARGLERGGGLAQAEALYRALRARGLGGAEVAVRLARVRELQGDAAGALAILREEDVRAEAADRLAVARAGRRVARGLGIGWPPQAPLVRPVERSLRLDRVAGEGARPRYGEGALTVEAAVIDRLATAGRRALHGEGAVWRTLFGLLFADAAFLPVPGQLPVPRLPGPLDEGTPAFASRRAAAVDEVLRGVRAGEAAARLRAAWVRFEGCVITGVDWQLGTLAELCAVVDGLGPDGLLAVLRPLLDLGRRAARGLPDLVVLPGVEVRVAGLHPGGLGGGVLLVEVKGEQDGERDAQRVWFDRLARAGVAVEVWRIDGGVRARR